MGNNVDNKIYLPLSLKAWNTPSFNQTIKEEILTINPEALPLQEGLTQSSYALSHKLSASIINTHIDNQSITVKTGLFYTGVISGCNCADDPTPVDELNEYCEVVFSIDVDTSETTVTLVN